MLYSVVGVVACLLLAAEDHFFDVKAWRKFRDWMSGIWPISKLPQNLRDGQPYPTTQPRQLTIRFSSGPQVERYLLQKIEKSSEALFAALPTMITPFQTIFAVPLSCESCIKDVSGSLYKLDGIQLRTAPYTAHIG